MQDKAIEYNGGRLAYSVAGSGKAVVLVHGFGEDGSIWQHQVSRDARRAAPATGDRRDFQAAERAAACANVRPGQDLDGGRANGSSPQGWRWFRHAFLCQG